MNVLVQKYGGSSLRTPEHIKRVAKRIAEARKSFGKIIVVVSAMGDTTDDLISLSQNITQSPSVREMDMLLTSGERISMALLSMALNECNCPAVSLTGSQSGIITDSIHTNAKILNIKPVRVKEELEKGNVVIVAGFQGVSSTKEITTLGRGGSDTTAVALAANLNAPVCEIYTDVEGVYSADPRIETLAKKLIHCSYNEMLEMSSLGAEVLHPRSVELAMNHNVIIHVKSSFNLSEGTIVGAKKTENQTMEKSLFRSVVHNSNIVRVSLLNPPDYVEMSNFFDNLSKNAINTSMIIMSKQKNCKNEISFVIDKKDLLKTKLLAEKIVNPKDFHFDETLAMVSIIGEGFSDQPGVTHQIFSILSNKGFDIQLFSASNTSMTMVVIKNQMELLIKTLHHSLISSPKE